MRNIITLFVILFSLNLHAQLGIKTKQVFNCKPILGDYLYMAETEISNIQYREFIRDLQQTDTQAARENYPDTMVWQSASAYNEPFVHYYFNHPAYKDYPVVGITQKQAINYCNWARKKILETYRKEKYPIQDIVVRLPTQKEWELAARGGLDKSAIFPWPGDDYRMRNNKKRDEGKIILNMMRERGTVGAGSISDAGFITVPVYAYWPNGFGLYNMCGNVAEWLAEPGKTKGGSWNDRPYYCRIDVPGKHDGDTSPRSTVGFRYVIEIVKLSTENIAIKKLNAKTIEAQFAKTDSLLKPGLFEVSNAWYQTFIQNYGQKNYAANDTLWLQKDPYKYHFMYSQNAVFKDHPVVNISYEAAVKYCEWLTQYYNQLPDRKYKSVTFRLPSQQEWETAARGGRVGNSFPWGGPYSQNSKGAYLANFHPMPLAYVEDDTAGLFGRKIHPYDSSASRKADGVEFTCPVKSYFPNDFGMYNVSGNAAEMVNTSGISKGGSWDSEEYFIEIGANWTSELAAKYNLHFESNETPAPTLGFRVFMEVQKDK